MADRSTPYGARNNEEWIAALSQSGPRYDAALQDLRTLLVRGLGYALGNIAPLYLMCDPRDLGTVVEVRSKQTKGPSITLYDRLPEGLGLSERLYDLHAELLTAAHELISSCACQDGCPVCVGPSGPGGAEVKTLTLQLLEALLPD